MNAHSMDYDVGQDEDIDRDAIKEKLIGKFAFALSKLDEEDDLFRAGKEEDASDDAKTAYEDYMYEAEEILEATGICESLALAFELLGKAPSRLREGMPLSVVEKFIAQKTEDVRRIDFQLQAWENGDLPRRDESWANRARIAAKRASANIVVAQNIRLRLTRSDMSQREIDNRDQLISGLREAQKKEKETRIYLCGRLDHQIKAAKAYIKENAPHLLEDFYEKLSASTKDYDEAHSKGA